MTDRSLTVSKFDAVSRAADFTFQVPFRALAPGQHLLTFEARLGSHTATRQVRFV